jgi:hypothetical protein
VQGGDDLDALPEEARLLAGDRDALLGAVQAAHEVRTARIDTLEDTLINTEAARAGELVVKHTNRAYTRNRDRIVEIVAYCDRNERELGALLDTEAEENDH